MAANTEHKAFDQPDPTDFVWRYIGIEKLLDLVHTRQLYLPAMSRLGDLHEGTLPRLAYERLKLREAARTADSQIAYEAEGFATLVRHSQYVSSWCLSNHESHALWNIYGKHKTSVALRIRYGDLVSSLDDACFIGKVKYIDYEVDDIDTSHYFHTTMHKRREFDYEKEVRIVQQAIPHDGGVILFPGFALASDDQRLARYPNGLLTRFDVASAIESIWLNPNAEQWFLEALQATLVSLGVPKDKLRTSGLGAQPRLATRRVTTLDQQLQERLEKAK